MFESLGLKCHFSVRIPTTNDSGSTFSNSRLLIETKSNY